MCRICDCRYSVREKIAAHDFVEQMREYYGLPEKYSKDRSRKNERKSIINKIEHQLYRLQSDSSYTKELRGLLNAVEPISDIQNKFENIMISYYKEKLNLGG
jgi:hypothetical protein